jgi:hypothetical protein
VRHSNKTEKTGSFLGNSRVGNKTKISLKASDSDKSNSISSSDKAESKRRGPPVKQDPDCPFPDAFVEDITDIDNVHSFFRCLLRVVRTDLIKDLYHKTVGGK